VGAIRFLLDTPATAGPFNLTAPAPVTNRQFSTVLGRVLGRPSFMPAPAFALKLALGEMSKIVLEGQRALPHRLEEAGYRFRFPDLEAALRDLLE
jgi:NAD dependent epimerase/dehydratase family enzyme